MENKSNSELTGYELCTKVADNAVKKLMAELDKENPDMEKVKLAREVIDSLQKVMKEHNSNLAQERGNKEFKYTVFKDFASDAEKQAIRDKLKVNLEDKIVPLLK